MNPTCLLRVAHARLPKRANTVCVPFRLGAVMVEWKEVARREKALDQRAFLFVTSLEFVRHAVFAAYLRTCITDIRKSA